MRGAGLVRVRWTVVAVAAALLVLPRLLGAQVPTQGINVHGHWVIEVRDADGTLRVRREFENAFQGQQALAQVLAGVTPMGLWIVFASSGSGGSNLCSGPTVGVCRIVEPGSGFAADSWTFKNLTKTVSGAFELVLQGSFVVSNSGTVNSVATEIAPPGFIFTSTNLPSPIPVQATQTVSVTVTVSFS